MRIDSHVHGDPKALTGDLDAYIEACRSNGVEAVVLIEEADRCLEAVELCGDFVIPVARVAMDHATAVEIEAIVRAGCLGIKFIQPAAPYGDERYWPLYEKLEQLGRPAVFHTGYLGCSGRELNPVCMEHMRAAQVERIARRFPDLKMLMAHYSNPWWEEGWKVSMSSPNVYADLSGGTAILRSTRMWSDLLAPDGQILEASIRKLCFGSDVGYFREGEFPFKPNIDFYERIFDAIDLPPELREQVNRGNVRTIFGLNGT
ncbi:MAG: amidohydrolase family protein [Candidatus Latescibacteria bacterium]|jgi:hypothetical protein|nr:amidohydrolase family protein [Candidatus Latescibacterota bacterium]